MKHGWEYRRLIDVCTGASTINWDTASSKQYIDLSSVDRESHKVSDTTTICKADAPSRAKQIVKMGDVIFGTTRPLLKRVCLVAPEYDKQVCSTGFCVLRPQKMVLPMWVYYCLQTDRFYSYIEPLQKGISYPAVSNDDVRNYVIPLPPLPVQEQICSLLDKLSRVIEAKKEQLKELDNLAQAIFYDMFGDPITNDIGWEVKSMKVVAPTVEFKGEHPQIDGKFWLLNLDKVEAQTGNILSVDYYDYDEIGNSVVSFDSSNVLYSKLRPYLNKVVVPTEIGYATSELVPLQPDNSLMERQYLAYLLRSKQFVEFINSKVAGAKMPRVTMSIFRDFMVPVPPLPLQQSFAEQVEAIERQKELINQSIREVQTLFDSRMDYWFSD